MKRIRLSVVEEAAKGIVTRSGVYRLVRRCFNEAGANRLIGPTTSDGNRFFSSPSSRPTAMTQKALDLFGDDTLPVDAEALIGRFREARREGGKALSTIAAEVSQLRSLARDAETHLKMALEELLQLSKDRQSRR